MKDSSGGTYVFKPRHTDLARIATSTTYGREITKFDLDGKEYEDIEERKVTSDNHYIISCIIKGYFPEDLDATSAYFLYKQIKERFENRNQYMSNFSSITKEYNIILENEYINTVENISNIDYLRIIFKQINISPGLLNLKGVVIK